MTKADTRLITFAISHYCEKARWALDWHGIDYREVGWPPGLHRILAKRAGAKRGSVPILLTGDKVVEGSDAVVDWAEANSGGTRPGLCPDAISSEVHDIEKRLDKKIGINVRRLIYSHVFPHQSQFVKPLLFANSSLAHRAIGNVMWPACKKLIVKAYKLDGNAAAESRVILEEEFNWLEGELGRDSKYLAGDNFSRADLSAASFLAPFAKPDEMPIYRDTQLPDDLSSIFEEWSDRPVMNWARDIYRNHRNQAA